MTTGLKKRIPATLALALPLVWLPVACTPVMQVEMSDKPITINLNVKIEHEIRVKVEKELDDLFEKEGGLF
jgi:hypothetical protein